MALLGYIIIPHAWTDRLGWCSGVYNGVYEDVSQRTCSAWQISRRRRTIRWEEACVSIALQAGLSTLFPRVRDGYDVHIVMQ